MCSEENLAVPQGHEALAENVATTSRAKHINLRVYALREKVNDGTIRLMFVPSTENIAGMLTKPLGRTKFEENVKRVMCDATSMDSLR